MAARLGRGAALIAAFCWAEWICTTTHLENEGALLRWSAGFAPLVLVVAWNARQRAQERRPGRTESK